MFNTIKAEVLSVLLLFFLAGCASRVELNTRPDYACIVAKPLVQTSDCKGVGIKIIGVRQEGRVAKDLAVHSIYVPEGRNYIYFNIVRETKGNGGPCMVMQEILVRHSEVPVPKLKRKPFGEELEIEVAGGGSYILVPKDDTVVLLPYEF